MHSCNSVRSCDFCLDLTHPACITLRPRSLINKLYEQACPAVQGPGRVVHSLCLYVHGWVLPGLIASKIALSSQFMSPSARARLSEQLITAGEVCLIWRGRDA